MVLRQSMADRGRSNGPRQLRLVALVVDTENRAIRCWICAAALMPFAVRMSEILMIIRAI